MDHLSLLLSIIEEDPAILYGQALRIAKSRGWFLDADGLDEKILSTPAWRVIYQYRISAIQADRMEKSKDKNTCQQYLETGEYGIFRDALNADSIKSLIKLSDNYHNNQRQAPLTLTSQVEETCFNETLILDLTRKILTSQDLDLMGNNSFAILGNRCLLRRTFSGEYNASMHGNINNQAWHQDSNQYFNSQPMLTAWIPLQDGIAINRPGLEISGLKPNSFNRRLGDSCTESDLQEYYNTTSIKSSAPNDINSGDCLFFNGLTFHQTYLNESMHLSRDVLLIRVCSSLDANLFPGAIENKVVFSL